MEGLGHYALATHRAVIVLASHGHVRELVVVGMYACE